MKVHTLSQMLERIPFFRDLTKLQHRSLALIMDLNYYASSEIIFREGALGNKFYIISEGAVEMRRKPRGRAASEAPDQERAPDCHVD